jgi:hypothetical protein
MAEKYRRHFAPLVNLRNTCGTKSVMNREFPNRKAATMSAGDELPPKSFFHAAKLLREHLGYRLSDQDVGAAWIVNGSTKHGLIEKEEESGKDAAHQGVSTLCAPPEHNVSRISNLPEAGKILGITLPVGIETKQKIRFQHVDAFAHGFGVAFSIAAHVQTNGQLSSEVPENLL